MAAVSVKRSIAGGDNVYATLVRVVAERGPARVNSNKRHDPKISDRA